MVFSRQAVGHKGKKLSTTYVRIFRQPQMQLYCLFLVLQQGNTVSYETQYVALQKFYYLLHN